MNDSDGPRERTPRQRLLDVLRPRASRVQAVVAVLCLVLGFAMAAQVRANREDAGFATARQDELVGILDTLSQRSERLRAEIRGLRETKAELEADSHGDAALAEARDRASAYAVLAGTVPAEGPGIELVIDDPDGKVTPSMMLDTLQELRDAGAEAIQVDDVRTVASTYFEAAGGSGVAVGGRSISPPYRVLAIGDPHTLATALEIPGGILESLRGAGAEGVVTQREQVAVTAVRTASSPEYARPARGERDGN